MLRSTTVDANLDAGRQMADRHPRVGHVAMLAARAGATEGALRHLGGIQGGGSSCFTANSLHQRDGHRGGVAAGLALGNPLHPMGANEVDQWARIVQVEVEAVTARTTGLPSQSRLDGVGQLPGEACRIGTTLTGSDLQGHLHGTPDGIRTRVNAVKERRPRPLDDGGRWLGREGSNPQHPAPKAGVLPVELRPTGRRLVSTHGSPGRVRTSNIGVQSAAFCQLNYRGMVPAEGLEPPTYGSVDRRSIQLSYAGEMKLWCAREDSNLQPSPPEGDALSS